VSAVRVKICGVTRLEDALDAVRLGADALGFNFWPSSKRYCSPSMARRIASRLPPFVTTVGVFVNQSKREIREISARVGLRALQLHGDESPVFCRGFALPVIKAVRVETPNSLQLLSQFKVDAFLLDTPSEGFGGSGLTFDWRFLRHFADSRPVILAGGLTPLNVGKAVAAVKPYAVDVASGVESEPGVKDVKKMAQFISAARSVK
jgi:phosphoribosylanthranilate isomerase